VQLALEARAANDAVARAAADIETRRLADFLAAVGLPLTLADLGVATSEAARREAVTLIADRATAAGETMHNMPFVVTAADVAAAVIAADALGGAVAGRRAAPRSPD